LTSILNAIDGVKDFDSSMCFCEGRLFGAHHVDSLTITVYELFWVRLL